MRVRVLAMCAFSVACGSAPETPAVLLDASSDANIVIDAADAADGEPVDSSGADGGVGCFEKTGVWGACMTTTACAALGGHTSTPGLCQGPSGVECCAPTPRVSDNPPIPKGYKLMSQAAVTPAMTTWAVAILHDPVTYPMFSSTTQTFGAQLVLARVEWHPPDFQNAVVHRGVTLYVPL